MLIIRKDALTNQMWKGYGIWFDHVMTGTPSGYKTVTLIENNVPLITWGGLT